MSKYKEFKAQKIKDYPLDSRPSKVNVDHFARPLSEDSISAFTESLPQLLAANDLRTLVEKIRKARKKGGPLSGGLVVMLSNWDWRPCSLTLWSEGS